MQTTELTLHTSPDQATTQVIAAALGNARGVLAVRLSTARGAVSIDYDDALTSPGRLQAALRSHGVPATLAEVAVEGGGGCCGGCCGG
ncbi:hypothetical protein IP92_05940 [Pseudoduganella flava]|uniref:Copper chaperone n=1 Tax=Pseudoduganella flava TaxID=871742 RepID=A0A562P6P7_9BURK|nr:hypothetical protein [Pseudoduganella flava]QGZ37976.1 hypothetical protein GO485_02210 [Pseudoduganella flava]TWI40124.1 hypothetical protein IP92_05940 [Pseudoduganella flava]